jgi:ATP-dependent helicase/nuclease subunit B
MKRLLIGPAGSGKTHLILDEFEKVLETQDPLLADSFFVLPSAEHTDRVITLLLQRGNPGFFFRRVTTLSHLISETFISGAERFTSNATRYLIMRDIFEKQDWDYFQAVQKTPGFMNLMLGFIAELKDAFISETAFRERMNGLKKKEPELSSKYEALAGIYEIYQSMLQARGLLDRQDVLRLSRAQGEKAATRVRKFKHIWLDGFYDFSNLQVEYLKELAALTENMTITLTCDAGEARSHLFEPVRRTRARLQEIGFETQALTPSNKRTSDKALQHLERHLFAEKGAPAFKAGGALQSLQFFEAIGIQGEVEMIAREILHLSQSGDYRFSDFAVLLRQIGGYESVLRSVFSRYEIPVEIHERERLKLSPLIETLRSLLSIFLEGWRREDILNFLKSSYVRRTGKDRAKDYEWVSELENFACQEGVLAGRENWFRAWSAQGQISEAWNERKNEELKVLADLEDKLLKAARWTEFQKILQQALLGTFEMLEVKDDYAEPVRRDAASAKRLDALLEEIRQQFSAQGRETISFQDFAEYLLRLIDIDLYSLHERNSNRVQVYDVSLARQKEYKVVFVAGLLEKNFPVHVKEDPVLSDWERQLFNFNAPVQIAERLPRQNLERYLFYLAVTRASERVVLSCPKLDLEGKQSLPSFYRDETRMLFGSAIPTKQQDLAHPYPPVEEAANVRELEMSLLGELWHPYPLLQDDKDFLLYLLHQTAGNEASRGRLARAFQEVDTEIRDPQILAGDFFKSSRTSATTLEDYAKCPFKYFSKRVLKLKDPHEEVNMRIRGIIRHQVVEYYFKERLKRKMDREATKQFALKELQNALREHPLVVEKRYQRELLEDDIRETLLRFLDAELNYLENSPFQPVHLEYSFGTGDPPQSPALEIQDGERVFKIVGKIDRIDVDAKEGKALVVDYKPSKFSWNKKGFDFGTSLQLPLYVAAVEKFLKLKPVGAELRFFNRDSSSGFYHKGNIAAYPQYSRKTSMPDAEFQVFLNQTLEYIKRFTRELSQGRIAVQPRQCDSFCPYPSVCRIQKWRLPLIAQEIREADAKLKPGEPK